MNYRICLHTVVPFGFFLCRLLTCEYLVRAACAGEAGREDEIGGEYCLSESFNASCRGGGAGQVVVMTAAEYGRMRSGRCVQMRYGQPGCRADVLARLDTHCSGRPACSFPVARLLQAGISPCDDELKSYLYASYRCVTGRSRGAPGVSTTTLYRSRRTSSV